MYLVDGNNVMGQRVGWHRDKPAARRRLVSELSALGRRQNVSVTVVFDGPPSDGMSDGHSIGGVTVFFAHPGSDADERMVELSRGALERGQILGVTSDRKLGDRLRSMGVKTVRSGQFRRMLREQDGFNDPPSSRGIRSR